MQRLNHKKIIKIRSFLLLIIIGFIQSSFAQQNSPEGGTLNGKIICIDPGHGGSAATDSYRQGPTGEREEWIDLRVGLLLKEILEQKGAKVLMTRSSDVPFPLAERSKMAVENKADFFISIHHNATADPSVNFPIIYYHGLASENQAGVTFGKLLAKNLKKYMYKTKTPYSVVSDFTIFSGAGSSVLRGTYGIPGVLAEASLFTNPEEEARLKTREHNYKEAHAIAKAIEKFFKKDNLTISPKTPSKFPPQFATLQEADRMSAVAKRWHQDYLDGKKLMKKKDAESQQKAYDLFTQSARSFPDSYVAAKCHKYRAEILRKQGKTEEALKEEIRVKEFYPN
ncbi:MAG: cell wall hydrolase [Sphingobacteriales bacterium 17-39-43]|uniref:N-acetylmuramoyl-L-alanine amidase family protein n=1 Tax=Daejeonella sp. TaxID=2805397 RepID=UPI000BC95C5C|nr:N-acetylmuramoyl-L-alanine amidase [Daejeonella sp.]OYZ29526.1 MAG: cell wall hydrolase [Sphingobacteriales bacterium 16-39-50]OZA22655.1 MAG: cell wall hydrolase [Sphingobacteriales bacterium 17-39-43]HQS52017.1 N-acetylmuramoyl-L-alanine amidase [Daejeonella sp.]HQT24456.1 N-acetylmuramoyl-L-alanine amidase [Daejeonella sp.]HQT58759.1 N-acetylmuramoyl-L-alanine amidase [Daejeonella sp.]